MDTQRFRILQSDLRLVTGRATGSRALQRSNVDMVKHSLVHFQAHSLLLPPFHLSLLHSCSKAKRHEGATSVRQLVPC